MLIDDLPPGYTIPVPDDILRSASESHEVHSSTQPLTDFTVLHNNQSVSNYAHLEANLMSNLEKIYSIFAVIFAIALTILLIAVPETRQLSILLPASGVGLLINVVLMFMIFRDIFSRQFPTKKGRIFWTGLLLVCWPAIIVYLPLYGFRRR